MKLAVCYSGQLRKLTKGHNGKLKKEKDCDIYIHTWDDIHNPNLSVVTDYFPDCFMDVEDYSQFDSIVKDFFNPQEHIEDGRLITKDKEYLRYCYAQYYTIYKSIKLAVDSQIDYDFFHRTRTDITKMYLILRDPKKYMLDIWRMFRLNTENLLKNTSDHLIGNYEKTSGTVTNMLGLVATNPHLITGNDVLFSDWNFTLNKTAAYRLTSLPVHKFMELVNKIHIESYNKMFSYNPASPFIWKKIFDYFGIVMVNFSDLLSIQKIDRGNADVTFVKNYGYVDK